MKIPALLLIFIILIPAGAVDIQSSGVVKVENYHWRFLDEDYFMTLRIVNGNFSGNVSFVKGHWRISMDVPQWNYSYYKEFPGGYRYAFNLTYLDYFLTSNDGVIRKFAEYLNFISREEGFDNLTRLNFILSFVQNALGYYDDLATTGYYDYYKFPLETLVEKGGDCEDKSILLATLAHDLGYDVVLFVMNITAATTGGHVAVGVHFDEVNYSNPLSSYLRDYYFYRGKAYFYMESTANQSFTLGYHVRYFVGISPEEAGYLINDLRVVPYRDSAYHGYLRGSRYVRELPVENEFPWYLVSMAISLVIFVPLFLLALMAERRKCPHCGAEIEEEWNYCPHCGYWLRYAISPPPSFDEKKY